MQLSSLGKFGQSENVLQTVVVDSREELLGLINTPHYKIQSVLPFENKCVVSYKGPVEESSGRNLSVVIASITAAYGRVILYQIMSILQRNLLYVDTGTLALYFAS
jgi:hypothetical protein